MQRAIYLIGFSAHDLNLTPSTAWLSMAGITSTVVDNVRCWTKEIERDLFDGPDAERNLSNIEWLTPRVLAHDTAVKALSNVGAFIPARFGTLYSSVDALHEQVARIHSSIRNFLTKIQGKQEWGIKCFVNRTLALTAYANASHQSIEIASDSGTNYLKARQRKRTLEMQLDQWIQDQINDIQQQLTAYSSAMVVRTKPATSDAASVRELTGNFAILANEETATMLKEMIEASIERFAHATGVHHKLADSSESDRYLTVEWSGPWPVYSFALSLETDAFSDASTMKNAG